MVEIKSFRGVHYNPGKFDDFSKLIAPPYDVISAEMQDELYKSSEYNIVRIIKGKDSGEDTDTANKYTRAGEFFNDWLEKNILVRDEQESIYIYYQEFTAAGQKYERTGFIALVKLEGYGKGVLPHEFTLKGPKADRLNLMRASKTHTGQVFCLYPDPEKKIDDVLDEEKSNAEPMIDVTDDEGIKHRLWAVTNASSIDKIISVMAEKQLFIADGHHRYETANTYMEENPTLEGAKYGMMTFVNMQNVGLVVLPTHRLVKNLEEFEPAQFEDKLQGDFILETFEFSAKNEEDQRKAMFTKLRQLYDSGKHAFGMYCENDRYYLVTLKDDSSLGTRTDIPGVLKQLDVTILHSLILDSILGIDEEKLAQQANVEYIKDTGTAIQESIDMVNSGEFQLVFFMNPPKVEEIDLVAGAGEKMPQKSTFFYPKVYSGLIINKIE
ncbi:MAG: DUF1015 domain-containing protein [Thermoplasmata archaeon]|nr:MAG: DUF1015 domain-containing protein [Thermoplasmata archaeon]